MVCGPSRTIGIVSILLVWSLAAGASGCSLGPRALERTRLPYNEAVKVTTEEQLLLNIVRLRYTDSPSSLGVTINSTPMAAAITITYEIADA